MTLRAVAALAVAGRGHLEPDSGRRGPSAGRAGRSARPRAGAGRAGRSARPPRPAASIWTYANRGSTSPDRRVAEGALGAHNARSISGSRSTLRSRPASRTENRPRARCNLDPCYPGLNLTRMPARAALEPAPGAAGRRAGLSDRKQAPGTVQSGPVLPRRESDQNAGPGRPRTGPRCCRSPRRPSAAVQAPRPAGSRRGRSGRPAPAPTPAPRAAPAAPPRARARYPAPAPGRPALRRARYPAPAPGRPALRRAQPARAAAAPAAPRPAGPRRSRSSRPALRHARARARPRAAARSHSPASRRGPRTYTIPKGRSMAASARRRRSTRTRIT